MTALLRPRALAPLAPLAPLALLALAALAGCDGDDAGSAAGATPAGAAPAGVEPPPAGVEPPPAGMNAGATPPPAGVEPPPAGMDAGATAPAGACTNAADAARFASLGEAGVDQGISGCIGSCLVPGPACGMCIQTATGFTAECTACFSDIVACTVMNCVANCINPADPACETCRVDNCGAAFEACAGLPL